MERKHSDVTSGGGDHHRKIYHELGFTSLEDNIERGWEANHRKRHPYNLIAMIDTWLRCDISQLDSPERDDQHALSNITARTVVMPSSTDLYFTVEDCQRESKLIPNSELVPIESIWGHRAGNPNQNPTDEAFIRNTVQRLLSE